MTGAPVPAGCDAVVMHEKTRREHRCVVIEETRRPSGSEPAAPRTRDESRLDRAAARGGAQPRPDRRSGIGRPHAREGRPAPARRHRADR